MHVIKVRYYDNNGDNDDDMDDDHNNEYMSTYDWYTHLKSLADDAGGCMNEEGT